MASTGDQDVAGQTRRLTQTGAIKVFSDVRSGRTLERPGLEALLAYAREGDTLAVVRLDRLGRSLGELLTTVAMLKERGIALLSLEERIDTNSAAGELVFHVFGAIAHFERSLIAERTKDGIAAARSRGKHPGRRPLDPREVASRRRTAGRCRGRTAVGRSARGYGQPSAMSEYFSARRTASCKRQDRSADFVQQLGVSDGGQHRMRSIGKNIGFRRGGRLHRSDAQPPVAQLDPVEFRRRSSSGPRAASHSSAVAGRPSSVAIGGTAAGGQQVAWPGQQFDRRVWALLAVLP